MTTTKIDAARALIEARRTRMTAQETERQMEDEVGRAIGYADTPRLQCYITGHDDASAAAAARIAELDGAHKLMCDRYARQSETVAQLRQRVAELESHPAAEPVRGVGEIAYQVVRGRAYHWGGSVDTYAEAELQLAEARKAFPMWADEYRIVAILDPSQIVRVDVGATGVVVDDAMVERAANSYVNRNLNESKAEHFRGALLAALTGAQTVALASVEPAKWMSEKGFGSEIRASDYHNIPLYRGLAAAPDAQGDV